MAETLKFIHAADFHLDEPVSGLPRIPAHLKTVLANAPYDAATRVFDLAISERVDFVLLAGDLFHIDAAAPRAPAFLLGQFERLAEKEIHVYWAGGTVDQPDRWPASIPLPENVTTFSSTYVDAVEHIRDGTVVATIRGAGHDPKRKSGVDFSAGTSETFAIALTHGDFDPSALTAHNVRYWALGGRHKPTKLDKTGHIAAYSGTPLGRSQKESGPHGCKIGRVDSSGKLFVQDVETDTVRWMPQKVAIEETHSVGELKKILLERGLKIATDNAEQTVLTNWYLSPAGDFNPALRRTEVRDELLEWLRDEFGRGEQGIWSVDLKIDPPESLPMAWYEEDTILGEYLRAVGRHQSDDSLKLILHDYMPANVQSEMLNNLGHVPTARRDEVLRRAALTGIEYLAVGRDTTATIDVDQPVV
ncbi:MAG: DNA repair exonuclease [Planctomycetota bacterium]